MSPLAGRAVVTAEEMRKAEADRYALGETVQSLMERAGSAIAEVVLRLGDHAPVLILCGPGNNGGDGYVAARHLAQAGVTVRVAASAPPASDAARAAAAAWKGLAELVPFAEPAPILVDALFGTGLKRPLTSELAGHLARLVGAARLSIAVDLPSGVATDDGAILGEVPVFELTLALGAAKPAHLLQPAASRMGAIRVLDIGVPVESDAYVLSRPALPEPGPESHKYSRGMVAIVGGTMPGAALLAAEAAMRAGAGYVALLGESLGGPHALVRKPFNDEAIEDGRIGALLIGPGLGRDNAAREKLARVLATDHSLVIDGDALQLLGDHRFEHPAILTPHAGEFLALFGPGGGGKIARARAGARKLNAVVVFKGADTVIAAPDGRVVIAERASSWLSTAGTGDVLAGAIAAMFAAGHDAFAAAQAGVWLHGIAARRLGPAFVADDLARALSKARS